MAQQVKNPPEMQETWVQFLGLEAPLEKEITTRSSILAWRTPWEEPGRLQSKVSQRVWQDCSHYKETKQAQAMSLKMA